MKYRVLKPFINIDGSFLRVNDAVDCSPERAGILRKNNMIGGMVETASEAFPIVHERIIETATEKKPKERRRRKKTI